MLQLEETGNLGGGVATFIKNEMSYMVIHVNIDHESVVIKVFTD